MKMFGKDIHFKQRKVPTIYLLLLALFASIIFGVNYYLFAYKNIEKYSQKRLNIPEEQQKATLIYARTVVIQNDMQAKTVLAISVLSIIVFIFLASHKLSITESEKKEIEQS